MAQYIGAIDSGTTSTRFMLFDQNGAIVAFDQREHTQIFPQSGWVEHDPQEIWERTRQVIGATLAKAQVRADDLAAVGITNQRETTIVWDRHTGKPVYNAIVWQDTRTAAICRELQEAGHGDFIYRKTGLPVATYFAGPKIRWILDNVSGAREAAERGDLLFGTVDTWLLWNLTGGRHITDVTNASRTMLMDLETLDWDEELLAILGIPRAMLPEIRPSSDPDLYGHTRRDGPFQSEVPLGGDLGDQQAATVGQTCFSPGEAKNTYGTGCFMLLNTGTDIVRSQNGLLTTVCYQMGNEPAVYALEGSIAMAGATVQWLRDNLQLIKDAAETEAIAQSVPDNGGCYLVPAFSGLFAPYWRSDARGVIVGLTRYVNRAHIVRAALESICYQTREVLEAMNADSGVPLRSLRVDGGATVNNFLMQLQADILGAEVLRPRVAETTSLGAAYAAGLAVGFWPDLESLRANWHVDRRWQPQIGEAEREAGYAGWKKAVTRTFNWVEA
ncbi:glycerol kinase GlpK [Litorilinea aerophila]|uniref:Glycerol kinase n=1 Tax=Litorilinea aerophila TaxID=1204385 RepID=A0A540VAQ8_9CHLR|nr:glycerol kinase GlpK [Litorilinea aerophila]MCC9078347.1 glycerol kinase GlpK [Litorilinea aerophila]OUC08718.1 glycerol kinase [Litorilinea aerophila]